MNITFDLETTPSQLPWVREEIRASIKPPGNISKPETIAAWMEANAESATDAAWRDTSFDGAVGQIVCIGWAVEDEEPNSLHPRDLSLTEERAMLAHWFDALRDLSEGARGTRPVLIGHNIIGFDIPFLWKRARVHGLKPPPWLPANPKPWADSVVDTQMLWDPTQRKGSNMERICRVLNIPGKGGFSGADVWPAAQRGEFDRIADYCRGDVWRTREMWRRMTFSAPASHEPPSTPAPAAPAAKAEVIEPTF